MAARSVRDIFEAALDLADEARAGFLDRSCRGRPEVRARVERLLQARTKTGDFLALPTFGAADEPLVSRVGPYALLAPLGEGGFGTVFLARQEAPVRREVALKILKAGMDSGHVAARFEAERQALATMNHPGIARVFDGGTTERGRPYFVMELVRGEPITIHCDGSSMGIRERLELFVEVAQAVQHAHQKGIIHRDLKPANVLVSVQDGKAVPKIIDFGVAKAVGGVRLSGHTVFTEQHQLVGTPQYMSPEQAEGSQDIDTRTDIYSLGVLLYELLTGTTPFDAERLRGASLSEVQRIIREEEPPRPSTRILALRDSSGARGGREGLPAPAEHRRLSAAQLAATLRSDLDWVVLKCLDKDRARRYETANALAMDIGRFLAGEPVLAAPPSTVYRMRKFVRRHRSQVAAAVLVALTLVGGIIGTTMFAWRAAQRAEETRQMAEFQAGMLAELNLANLGEGIRDDLLRTAAQGWEWSGVDQEARAAHRAQLTGYLEQVNFTGLALRALDRDVIERTLQKLDQEFGGRPLLKARMLQSLAEMLGRHGLTERARAALEEVVRIREAHQGPDHLETLAARHALGVLLAREFPADAEPHLRRAFEGRTRRLGPDHRASLQSERALGGLLMMQGKYAEAEPMLLRALDVCRKSFGEDDDDTLLSRLRLGQLYLFSHKLDKSEEHLVEAHRRWSLTRGPDSPQTLQVCTPLANLRLGQERPDLAQPLFRAAAAGSARVLGEDHPSALLPREMLMGTLKDVKAKEAELRAILEIHRRNRRDAEAASILWNWGQLHLNQDPPKLVEAEACFREAHEGFRRAGLHLTPLGLVNRELWAQTLEGLQRPEDARDQRRSTIHEYLDTFTSNLDVNPWKFRGIGYVEWRGPKPFPIDNPVETGLCRPFYFIISKTHDNDLVQRFTSTVSGFYGATDPRMFRAISTLAFYLWQNQRYGDAIPLAERAVEGLRLRAGQAPDPALANALFTLAVIRRETGRAEEALSLFEEAVSLAAPDQVGLFYEKKVWIESEYARCLVALSRFDEAQSRLLSCHERLLTRGPPNRYVLNMLESALGDLYEARHAVEPTLGHDAEAARWRSTLPNPHTSR